MCVIASLALAGGKLLTISLLINYVLLFSRISPLILKVFGWYLRMRSYDRAAVSWMIYKAGSRVLDSFVHLLSSSPLLLFNRLAHASHSLFFYARFVVD